uniref:Retrotransposon protein, putative, unclassified, expressed n=2 Tax=Oryza sativa subsp. japonica TaxID=39947 RepID=Q53JX1_ORYSJ|nr:retrotransposon protein, putative, unclassified [Oryza sativa Japonica Group]ABA93072.1 retrotransposon protein, putative, unclassified, expressed [Oryza sativa Japonica Group]
MKVDGNPFPVNMVHIAGRSADEGKTRGSQLNTTRIINKYQRRFCWNEAKFEPRQADVDDVEEVSARLVLSPEQAIFEKPEGTENRHLKPLYINGFVKGKPMSKMMVDGGAAVNLMPYTTFRKLDRNSDDLIKTNMVLKDFGGNPSETKGVLNVELTVSSKTVPTIFFVIDGKGSYSLLLGRDWIHANFCIHSTMHYQLKMESPNYYFEGVVEGSNVYTKDTVDDLNDKQGQGFMSADDLEEIDIGPGDRPRPTFLSKNLSLKFRTKLIELLKEYRDCFAWEYYEMLELSRSIVEHRLPIKPGVRPYQQPPRRCKADMLDAIKAEKNGKVRVCIDFRDLNNATPKDEYPMPVVDQLVDAASWHKILSWFVEVYIDDVVVKSKEVEDHIADLRKVFERTRKYGLKMNPTKCAFGVSAGQFLGFLVHERGIELRHYLLSNECIVICKADVVKYMLSAPILKGKVGKWIFALTEFDLRVHSWLWYRLSYNFPSGESFEFAYTIMPYATNNQAEYEAVLKGLQLLKEVEADAVEIMGDSLLVISQLAGEYECKNDTLMVYNEKCRELMDGFRLVILKHVSREQNVEANNLAQGASGYKPMMRDIKVEVATITADDWRYDVYQYLQNLSQSASQKLHYKALKYTLLDDELYYRMIDGVLLKCLSADQAMVVMGERGDSTPQAILDGSDKPTSTRQLPLGRSSALVINGIWADVTQGGGAGKRGPHVSGTRGEGGGAGWWLKGRGGPPAGGAHRAAAQGGRGVDGGSARLKPADHGKAAAAAGGLRRRPADGEAAAAGVKATAHGRNSGVARRSREGEGKEERCPHRRCEGIGFRRWRMAIEWDRGAGDTGERGGGFSGGGARPEAVVGGGAWEERALKIPLKILLIDCDI